MSGGRFVGWLLALPLAAFACGGRAELGSDDGGAAGANSLGGKAGGGKGGGRGGAGQGGMVGNGGQIGAGGAPSGGAPFGGTSSGGAPWAGSGGAVRGGAPNGGAASGGNGGTTSGGKGGTTSGGATSGGSGVGGSTACPCRPYVPGACSYEICDPGSQRCIPISLEGQSCDDHDFCTVGEFCRAGICQGGTKNTCGFTEDACTSVQCVSSGGFCVVGGQPDGTVCKSADLCESSAACLGGKCVPTSYRDCSNLRVPGQCYAGQCNSSTGNCEAVPLSGVPCSTPDLCSRGTCFSGKCLPQEVVDCSGLDTQCGYGECVSGQGTCVAHNYPDGSGCFTDACTENSVCSAGVCKPGTPITRCISGDGCCPAGCSGKVDTDCSTSFTLDAVNRGWWNSLGDHSSSNDNTFTGALDTATYNSYFTFDLRSVGRMVRKATLLLEQESFFGSDRSEQVSIWDVSTDATKLEADGVPRNTAIFVDLQSGARFGGGTAFFGNDGAVLAFELNDAALSAINAALGGFFSVGVHVDTTSGAPTHIGEGVRFSEAAEPRFHQLQIDAL